MLQFDEAIFSTVRTAGKLPQPPEAPAAGPLLAEQIEKMNRYWSAANYLTIGQIYLQDNPLLREPLRPEHIKPRLLGHWGTSPGLSFIYVHLNRLIKVQDVDMIYLAGPRRPRAVGTGLSGGHVFRHLSRRLPGCRGDAPSIPAVFVARWHPQPCQRHDPRLHSRGRRTRLCPGACLWRCFR